MIALFGNIFGFLSPYLLLAVPVGVGLIVFAFLRRGRGKRVIVSSTLLLQKLERRSPARSKFVPPPRFFFELLLLILLLIGASGFYQERPRDKVAVLVDNSYSMAASGPGDAIDEWLLAKAKTEIRWQLNNLRSQATVNLFVSSPELRSVTDGFTSQNEALRILERVRVSQAPDRLEAAMRRLAAQPEFQKIIVVSDRKVRNRVLDEQQGVTSDERVEFVTVATGDGTKVRRNIAISDIGLTAVGEKKVSINVSVTSYLKEKVDVRLLLSSVNLVDPQELRKVKTESFALEPGKTKKTSFPSRSFSDRAYLAKAVIFPVSTEGDDLLDDNTAWIVPAASGGKAVLVGPLPPKELGLNNLPVAQFDYFKPEQYDRKKEDFSNDLIVFHRYVPSELPKVNSLFVYPEIDNDLFVLKKELSGEEITRWAESNEIIKYLNVPSLNLSVVRPISLPVWGEGVITTTAGSVLVSGEQGGSRYVITGFELFPYEGKKAPVLTVLTLNLFKWLYSSGLQTGYQSVYSRLAGAANANYIEHQETIDSKLIFEEFSPVQNDDALLSRKGLVRMFNQKREPSFVAVNFFNEQESNLGGTQPIVLPSSMSGDRSGIEKYPFTSLLGLIVLVLLCLDSLFTGGFLGIGKKE